MNVVRDSALENNKVMHQTMERLALVREGCVKCGHREGCVYGEGSVRCGHREGCVKCGNAWGGVCEVWA